MVGYLAKYSRELKKRPTPAELRFKAILKTCTCLDFGFEFQKPFYNREEGEGYIADFYLPRYRLIFEIDGGYHDNPEQTEKDKRRDKWFEKNRCLVVRVENEQTENINECRDLILKTLYARKWTPRVKPKRVKTKKGKVKKVFFNGKLAYKKVDGNQLQIQDDPQKAYEQCKKHLESLGVPKESPIIKLRKKGVHEGLGPGCQFGG